MFGVQHTSNHPASCPSTYKPFLAADVSRLCGRTSLTGSHCTVHSRLLHVRCSSTHTNNVVHMRASAAATSAQLACEQSSVQDLLAHVVQSSSQRARRHRQRQTELQHVIDVQQHRNDSVPGQLGDHVPLGYLVETASAPRQHEQLLPEHQQEPPQQHWQALSHGSRQRLRLADQHRQQVHHQALVEQQEPLLLQVATAEDHMLQQQQQQQQQVQMQEVQQQDLQEYVQQQQQHVLQERDALLQQRADVLLQETSSLLDVLEQDERHLRHVQYKQQQMLDWSKQETVQGWKYSQQDRIARTAEGIAVLRLSTAAQPQKHAKQLLSWLRREQQVVLSAAGAALAFTALECLAQLQQLLQQQHPQYQLLVTVDFRSSSRPEGRGRCEVYNLTCRLQDSQQCSQLQLPQQQQWHQQPLQHRSTRQHRVSSVVSTPAQQQMHQHSQLANGSVSRQPVLQACQHHVLGVLAGSSGPHMQESVHTRSCEALNGATLEQQRPGLPGCGDRSWSAGHAAFMQPGCANQPGQQRLIAHKEVQHHSGSLRLHKPGGKQRHQLVLQNPPAAALQQVDVRGTAVQIADVLDASLQQSPAVVLPLAYAKQAVKVLQAAAVLARRWQHQQAENGCCLAVFLSVAPGSVRRQSGKKQGLHVFVFAAPVVQ